MRNPCPIVLRIAVPARLLSRRHGVLEEHAIDRMDVESEVIGIRDQIAGIFDSDAVSGIVLAIQETRHAEDTVAVRAGRVATEGDGEQLQCALLSLKVEAIDAPEHLILPGRR